MNAPIRPERHEEPQAPRADAARPFARGFGEGEPRPRGALGTIYALKGGIGMGGTSFRAEPRGHHAAACTLRAATAWRHEGLPERIPRAKPLRARSGKGSMEKFPYITEHGPINLPFAWDGKESGDSFPFFSILYHDACLARRRGERSREREGGRAHGEHGEHRGHPCNSVAAYPHASDSKKSATCMVRTPS